ncbi:Na+/H+ antiporter NhaA [Arenibaculum pallidiluteum]|uniref:Na+/H+ antiporter NhaA n=1 Tax=Arenibaculum pallidiluteum TaxID=2812559 RepID=UPI001A97207A|nr:Na+/H+ antiporter NhaA [Arenibaculum pallidiluteum]
MAIASHTRRPLSMLRHFLENEASAGLVLMGAATLALIVANSPLADAYSSGLHAHVGPLSVEYWINDGLMAVFFLLVGLEIKREILDGQLSTWPRRVLPGISALGGMVAPALIYVAFNWGDPATIRGWAIPTATDIAFALGVLKLIGPRVPTSLQVFLAALAIIDDLGAVVIIALFYTSDLSVTDLALAGAVLLILTVMNRRGVTRLWAYLLLGFALWFFVFRSGVHATIAGVALAFTIPLAPSRGRPDDMAGSPLHRLEHGLHNWVAFLIVPVFAFANAGVSLEGVTADALLDDLTLGVAFGLLLGKMVGVFGCGFVAVRVGLADVPMGANKLQFLGVSLLCGIGFTMSLFIGLLAFANDPALQEEVKIGILSGSLLAGLAGWAVLRFAPRTARAMPPASRAGSRATR